VIRISNGGKNSQVDRVYTARVNMVLPSILEDDSEDNSYINIISRKGEKRI